MFKYDAVTYIKVRSKSDSITIKPRLSSNHVCNEGVWRNHWFLRGGPSVKNEEDIEQKKNKKQYAVNSK